VFLQSDIEALAVEMCDRFDADPAFQRQSSQDWLPENPYQFKPNEKIHTVAGEPVYRALFVRC
jgi:tRNA (guanine-N7-)-methyltransferase